MGLDLGGIGDHHRDAQGPGLGQVAVVPVPLDDHHPLVLGDESLDHGDAYRAEPDHDDVVGHAVDLAPPERALDAPADEDVGEEGEPGRDQGHPDDDEGDPEDLHGRVLCREAVVAVADGGHRLHREVGRGQHAQPAVGTGHVIGEAEDDGGQGDEGQQ